MIQATGPRPQGVDRAARLPVAEDDLKVKIGRSANDYTKGLPLGRAAASVGRVVDGNTRGTRATLDVAKMASRTGQENITWFSHLGKLPRARIGTLRYWPDSAT